jgi:hypothetical protein
VIALVFATTALVEAKPLVVVKTEFGPAAKNLRKRIANDLRGDGDPRAPEAFITEQLLASLAPLRMFEFKPAVDPPQSQYVLSIVIDSPIMPWPLGDVQLTLTIAGQSFQLPFCFRAACYGVCIPPSFTSSEWYKAKFDALLAQWPPGFLKNIPLSTAASYKRGRITVPVDLAELGQPPNGPPTAFFELLNGSVQRQLVFCRTRNGQAEGDDHGDQAQPNCSTGPIGRPLDLPGLGTVTLLKGLL